MMKRILSILLSLLLVLGLCLSGLAEAPAMPEGGFGPSDGGQGGFEPSNGGQGGDFAPSDGGQGGDFAPSDGGQAGFPEGMMLAILFGNMMAPTIDYFVVQSNINKRLRRARA